MHARENSKAYLGEFGVGDAAAVSAMLDRLLHHGHVLKCGPRSWRTKFDPREQQAE